MSKKLFIKKGLTLLAAVLVAALIVIQFFRIDRSAPPIVVSDTLEAAVPVPPDISAIIGRSCNDCHSNTTVYPWYTNIQPVGWFMKNHIDDAHREVNFSIFNTYTAKRKAKKFDEICEQVKSHEMPLPSYLWIHRDAALSDTEIKAVCDWTEQAKAAVAPVPAS